MALNKALNLTALATTTVRSGPGRFGGVVVNKVGTTDTITVYDNTAASGRKICTITPVAGFSYLYDCDTRNGLTVVIAGGAAGDYTILF